MNSEKEKSILNQNEIEKEISDILTKNPDINVKTFLNILKAKNMKIVKEVDDEKKILEPASFIKDEDIWNKAKKAVLKYRKKTDPLFYPIVVAIYKKMGGTIKKGKKEAETSSSHAELQRESFKILNAFQIKETAKSGDPIGATKFKVALIQEGLGSLSTAFFYTKDALKNSFHIFEGKKIYADHPTSEEEETRPERSVRDILGHFENVKYEEDKDGRGMITGEVSILQSEAYRWARELMIRAIDYSKKFPDKNFIGLSINASGEFEEAHIDDVLKNANINYVKEKLLKAKQEGIEKIRIVKKIIDALSCDLVTEPGADGKVLEIKESLKEEKMEDEKKHEDETQDVELIKKLIAEYLGEDHNEEDIEAALEAYHALGENVEKSSKVKAACDAMKAAKKILKQKQEEAEEAEEAKEAKKHKQAKEEEAEVSEEAEETKKHKESASLLKQIAELKGEILKLKEAKRIIELEKVLNEKLKVVSDPKMAKEIKESAMKQKTNEAALSIVDAFLKGYKTKESSTSGSKFFLNIEKQSLDFDSNKKFSFEDCLK